MQSDFLKIALDAVKNAEEIILNYYSSDIRAELKSDQTPVTLADTGAEEVIKKTIKDAFPDHSFLGEELGKESNNAEYLWIIDPIDGTRNYVRQIPLFATQLALMHNGELILGISNAPALKELMWAEKGQGAYLNGEKVYVSKTNKLEESYLSSGSLRGFNGRGLLSEFLALAQKIRVSRDFGDAWSYHLLAQGKSDALVEAWIKIWDIAALKVIVEEAGGMMTDLQGNPVTTETTFVVATNGILHKEVLSFFQDHE